MLVCHWPDQRPRTVHGPTIYITCTYVTQYVRVLPPLILSQQHFNFLVLQIMALVVTGLGLMVTMSFQIFIRENPNANPPKLKWYKWLTNPEFYLVRFQASMQAMQSELTIRNRCVHKRMKHWNLTWEGKSIASQLCMHNNLEVSVISPFAGCMCICCCPCCYPSSPRIYTALLARHPQDGPGKITSCYSYTILHTYQDDNHNLHIWPYPKEYNDLYLCKYSLAC